MVYRVVQIDSALLQISGEPLKNSVQIVVEE